MSNFFGTGAAATSEFFPPDDRLLYGSCCKKTDIRVTADTNPDGEGGEGPEVHYSWVARVSCSCYMDFYVDTTMHRVYRDTKTCPKDIGSRGLSRSTANESTFYYRKTTYDHCCYGCTSPEFRILPHNPNVAGEPLPSCECERLHVAEEEGTVIEPWRGLDDVESTCESIVEGVASRAVAGASCSDC
tara:strand:+ start:3929 stop:4489 length:561 start_codon:yes stop_codon:yes gene_type:complete